jgi:hypothetical protein
MGDEEVEPANKDLNLESIIDNEIFPPEKNLFKRAKQRLEKTIVHHKNKIIIPISTAIGGLGYYFSHKTIEGLYEFSKILNPGNSLTDSAITEYSALIGFSLGYFSYLYSEERARKYIGKKIIGIKKGLNNIKKKKESFLYRNRLGLALISTSLAVTYYANLFQEKLQQSPPEIREAFNQNIDKFMWGFAPLGLCFLAGTYLAFSLIGGKKPIFENKSMRGIKGEFLYKLSKNKGVSYLENESKKGNIYADSTLALMKENIDEKLEHEKKVIERIKEQNAKEGSIYYSEEVSFIKNSRLGYHYSRMKGNSVGTMITIAMAIYPSNPDRAVRLLNKLSEAKSGQNRAGILSTRNYFLNIHEADKKEDWQELISWLEKEGKMQLIKGSEGRTSSFFDDFTNKNFIFKEYREDKSDKFFIEREILNILKGSEIKVENPLLYYDEGSIHKQVFIRDGEKNLREYLTDKSLTERREVFEKVIPLLLEYQQTVSSHIEENDSGFFMNTEFRGEKRRITIPILNLEQHMKQKAFYGSKTGELRLGENSFLPNLIVKIYDFKQHKLFSDMIIFNHGDPLAPNFTSNLCIIDPRPTMTHPLFDLTYFAIDPVFLEISFDSRKEKILEEILKSEHGKGKELEIKNAFDYFYFHNAIGLAGSRLAHGKPHETEAILSELVKFSKDKGFQNELLAYLNKSNAKKLLKSSY